MVIAGTGENWDVNRIYIVFSFSKDRNDLNILRVDAYFFENGEKKSVFKNNHVRVDEASCLIWLFDYQQN